MYNYNTIMHLLNTIIAFKQYENRLDDKKSRRIPAPYFSIILIVFVIIKTIDR